MHEANLADQELLSDDKIGKSGVLIRPSQVPTLINFWLCTILAIIGIVHVLFYLMLIAKHMASVYILVKCSYTCKNCMIGL